MLSLPVFPAHFFRAVNVNRGHSRELLEACAPLREYSWLVAKVRDRRTADTVGGIGSQPKTISLTCRESISISNYSLEADDFYAVRLTLANSSLSTSDDAQALLEQMRAYRSCKQLPFGLCEELQRGRWGVPLPGRGRRSSRAVFLFAARRIHILHTFVHFCPLHMQYSPRNREYLIRRCGNGCYAMASRA